MGSYRNVGNHENKGIGTNSEPDYAGNTNSSGVTDKTGQPLPGAFLTDSMYSIFVTLVCHCYLAPVKSE